MTNYDVIVVGAGPVGSTYAYKMAKQGYNVGLFDMKIGLVNRYNVRDLYQLTFVTQAIYLKN